MKQIHLNTSEWHILSCLWEKSPQTLMQLVSQLNEKIGWAKSTTITILHRMEDKGLVQCEMVSRGRSYTTNVDRDDAVLSETRSFLERVYQGSVGVMMSSMAKQQTLSKDDIAELKAILAELEEESK